MPNPKKQKGMMKRTNTTTSFRYRLYSSLMTHQLHSVSAIPLATDLLMTISNVDVARSVDQGEKEPQKGEPKRKFLPQVVDEEGPREAPDEVRVEVMAQERRERLVHVPPLFGRRCKL